jgi:hypothetical protein
MAESLDALTEPSPTEKERVYYDNLQVPVNPNYDFEADPGDQQFEYANPVHLSNKLVLYTNAAILLARNIVSLARKRERLRLEKKEVDRKLRDLRRDVLVKNPAPPSAAKNLLLTDAFMARALESEGLLTGYQEFERRSAELEDQVEALKDEGENLRFTMQTIQLAASNVTNALSWTKAEARMTGRVNGP